MLKRIFTLTFLCAGFCSFVTGFASRYGLIDRGQITGEGSFAEPDAAARIDRHLSI